MNATNWLPGLLALGAALVVAAGYVFLSLRKAAPAGKQEEARKRAAELDAQYQTTIRQLRELKAEQPKLTPEAYEAQRAELEKRAADVLRAKETQATPAPAPAATQAATAAAAAGAPKGFFAQHPQMVGALWGGGVVAFFAVLGVLLFTQAKPQADGGGPMQQAQGDGQPQQGADELEQAMEHLREHPEDADTAAMVGHELLRRQDWAQAAEVTARALGADPFNVENRIHRAAIKAQRGDPAAQAELQHLADTYPGAQEALLFLASVQAQAGSKAKALDDLERYVTVAPPEEQSIELYQAMAQFRRELGLPPAP